MRSCESDTIKHELRVTSYQLLVTSWNLKVRVRIHELRVHIHESKSTSYDLKSTSYEFRFTRYESKYTSYEFKSTSSRIIQSMKAHENSLKLSSFPKILSLKSFGNSWDKSSVQFLVIISCFTFPLYLMTKTSAGNTVWVN